MPSSPPPSCSASGRLGRPAPRLGLGLAGLTALLALSGCTTAPEPPQVPRPMGQIQAPTPPTLEERDAEEPNQPLAEAAAAPQRPPLAQVKSLLAYADHVATLPTNELAAEIARLAPVQDESVQHQLELGMALGQTRQPVDTARALGLVQRALAQKDNPATVQSLARLLENRYLQQRRLEDQLDRQGQQLRDAQRRNDQLSDRLEAMRAIERSLNARPGGPANGKNGAAALPSP